jgi:hypothetical protein
MSDAGIDPATLLARLDEIGTALRDSGHALALLGLGSVGLDRERLDRHSDLDFFAIVERGHKARYLANLDWLQAPRPIAWHYRNTVDGFRALMDDGVFCEFAVFEPQELDAIPFAPGRVVWKRADVDESIAVPRKPAPDGRLPDEEWIVGETLALLFVGMQRWRRGEKLSAARLVQVHAVDRLIELDALRAQQRGESGSVGRDPFSRERRLELSRPALAAELATLMPGYEATPQAVRAIVAAFERRGAVLDPAVLERL